MLRFDLNGDGFGGGNEWHSVLRGEPGGEHGVIEEICLILCSFVKSEGDSYQCYFFLFWYFLISVPLVI